MKKLLFIALFLSACGHPDNGAAPLSSDPCFGFPAGTCQDGTKATAGPSCPKQIADACPASAPFNSLCTYCAPGFTVCPCVGGSNELPFPNARAI